MKKKINFKLNSKIGNIIIFKDKCIQYFIYWL